jgi:protein-disulfide isomerase
MASRAADKAALRALRGAGEQRERTRALRAHRLRLLALAAAGALVLVAAAVVLGHRGATQAGAPGAGATTALFAGIPQHGLALGRADAPLTLEEYADLQCPFCRQFTATVLPRVVRDYVRTGKVRLVFRNLTFIGADSMKAAQVAAAAGEQNRLWQFIDRFYANQKTENTGYVTDGFLRGVAGQVPGLDAGRALGAAGSAGVNTQLQQAARRAEQLGINSTPSFALGRTGGDLRPLAVDALDPAAFAKALAAAP